MTSLTTEKIVLKLEKKDGEYKMIESDDERVPDETLKIVQISDIHWDLTHSKIDPDIFSRVINISNDFEPDLVLITGDIVDKNPQAVHRFIPQVKKLKSKRGIFAILGNHDYHSERPGFVIENNPENLRGSEIVVKALEEAGIRVLINETEFPFGTSEIALVGIGEKQSPHFNPSKVLNNSTMVAPLTLVMSHNPDTAKNLSQYPFTLQFSGHTHGGQICFPFTKTPVLKYLKLKWFASFLPNSIRKFLPRALFLVNTNYDWFQGFHKVKRSGNEGDNLLYTSRGLATHPPFRSFCDPEVTLFKLHLYSS